MNKLSKLLVGVVALTAASAFAQGSTKGYLQDARGGIAGSGSGLCWRTNSWTPADAVKGCDDAYIKAAAPVAVAAPKPGVHLPDADPCSGAACPSGSGRQRREVQMGMQLSHMAAVGRAKQSSRLAGSVHFTEL